MTSCLPSRSGTGGVTRGLAEPRRTGANARPDSTSWGSLARAQYRPSKGPAQGPFLLRQRATRSFADRVVQCVTHIWSLPSTPHLSLFLTCRLGEDWMGEASLAHDDESGRVHFRPGRDDMSALFGIEGGEGETRASSDHEHLTHVLADETGTRLKNQAVRPIEALWESTKSLRRSRSFLSLRQGAAA
jgi:hypothetical protein